MDRAPAPTGAFTIQDFVAKWRGVALSERAAAQSHFVDLCRALGVPAPTDADPTGAFHAFERGAEKTSGGQGWADVWFRGPLAKCWCTIRTVPNVQSIGRAVIVPWTHGRRA